MKAVLVVQSRDSIYNKGDRDSISDKEIKELLKAYL